MPDAGGPASALDLDRLERIVEPWATDVHGLAIAIEDPDGTHLAGRTSDADRERPRDAIRADVVVDGAVAAHVVARLVASGETLAEARVRPIVDSLAIAIGELLAETRSRADAERALAASRAAAAADSLGTDAAELAKGRLQQRSILSLVPPDVRGYDLASHYAAAREIGGDFFELFPLPWRGHPLGIVIADVTGKGLDAALLMAFARPVMHSALNASRGPADALERTNHVLVDERRGTLFITVLCAVLEPRTGRVRVASAGHEPPLLVPSDGGPIRAVGDPGVLMGAFAALHAPEVEMTLEPGDTLLFYTDGVTDAVNPAGGRFGDDRLLATIEAARAGTAHDLVAAISEAVRVFRATAEPADDLTLVAVGRQRPRAGRRAART